MTDKERYELYIICKKWNEHKSWENFKALWSTFEPWVWWGERLYYIVRNTLNGKYVRVCKYYRETYLE